MMNAERINLLMLAHEILNMQAQLDQQEMELEELREYRRKYFELMNDDIKKGEEMVGKTLAALVNRASDAVAEEETS